MRVAFDTSVLVAAVVARHPHHDRAIVWLDAARRDLISGLASWHAAAETYSVLTRLPLSPRISTEQAERVVRVLGEALEMVPPTAPVYRASLARCAANGIRSGGLFDALDLVTAERSRAELFLTFNVDDFARLTGPDSPEIVAPPDPPSLRP